MANPPSGDELSWQKATDDPDAEAYLEIAFDAEGMVHIRESTRPDVVAVTTPAKWDAFVKGVRAGEFDHFVEE